MSRTFKCFLLLLSIAAASGVDKDKAGKFDPGAIASFPNRQLVSKLTIGARAVETDEQARPAFGKLNPYEFGVLPVLVVMQNDGGETLSLEGMRVEYVTPKREHLEAIPAQEVKYERGVRRPSTTPSPLPRLPGRSVKKNPLAAWEIEGRAFSARMLPAGQTASGFFYFTSGNYRGALLYVTGIREAATGKELFFVEIPLDKAGE